MGNNLDCCHTTRGLNQCIFPCFRFCNYTNRRVFYNFDGLETVQPLVHFYFPKTNKIKRFHEELKACEEDVELGKLMKSGMDPIGQLCVLCAYASKNNYTVRAVGSGASWSRITSTRDILVDMKHLNRILTRPPSKRSDNLTKEFVDIEVEGGMLVIDFLEKIDKEYGLGLPMIGNYAGQTIAGVAMTSTHGSGYFTGTLSTSVVGLHLITCRGIQVRIEHGDETFDMCKAKLENACPCGDPVVMKSTALLQGSVVSIGSIGIVYSITYRCIPVYNLEETRSVTRIPWNGKVEDFKVKERFFNTFTNPDDGEYFSFFVNPYPQPQRFLYAAILKSKRTTLSPGCCLCCNCWCGKGGRGSIDCAVVQNDCTVSCLQSCANCCPSNIPDITNYGISLFDRENYPFVQKYYNVLQFTNGNIHVRTAEWCLPLDNLNEALFDVILSAIQYAERHNQYSLLPIYVRIAKTDELLLSPANKNFATGTAEHCCYIEVPFMPGAFGTDEYQATIEDLLFEKYKARPHWGKNNRLNARRVREIYPGLPQWKKILSLFNVDGTFCNEFTRRVGFDEVIDDVISTQPT